MSSIPEGVKMPDDHKSPAQREAEGETTVTVEFDGHSFALPADPLDWPTRAVAAFEDGKAVAAIRGVLGDKMYGKAGIDEWPLRKTVALFEKFAEAAGLADSGE